jgi:hypothetical protein
MDRPQMTKWRIRIARWVTKVTDTHSEYVILIVFLLQKLLHESASVLGYTYVACLVKGLCSVVLVHFIILSVFKDT